MTACNSGPVDLALPCRLDRPTLTDMWNRLTRLFEAPEVEAPHLAQTDRLQLATACLLVEAARMDDTVSAEERQRVHELVKARFHLSDVDTKALIEAAEREAADATQWYGFTSRLVSAMEYDERIGLIEMLWEVVWADRQLHHLEASLMRRVGGLLQISDRDRGEALRRVKARLGID